MIAGQQKRENKASVVPMAHHDGKALTGIWRIVEISREEEEEDEYKEEEEMDDEKRKCKSVFSQ